MDDFELTLRFQWRTAADIGKQAKKLRLLAAVLESAGDPRPVVTEPPAGKRRRNSPGGPAHLATEAEAEAGIGDTSALEPEVRRAIIYGLTQQLFGLAGGSNAVLDLLKRFRVRKLHEVAAAEQVEAIELLQAALAMSAPTSPRGRIRRGRR